MAEKKGAKKYVEELEITVEIQDQDLGLTFFNGSSPPRVQKINLFSYFYGMLYIGDVILQVDKRVMKSTQDITEAFQLAGAESKTLRIRFRRDNYYKMQTLKLAVIRKKPSLNTLSLQIRWREDLPVGIIVEKKAGAGVIVSNVEPGSVAEGHIFPGDIILDVNNKEVGDITEAKKAIRQSIVEKRNVLLKIERDITPLKRIADPAEDVRAILSRNAGFWNRRCRLRSIEEEEGGKPKRVYHVPNVESESLPVDETGKKLVATPSRDGGTRTEEPVEAAEEEPATEEEEV
ncbi:hypothetical protein ACQ4LE_006098 [Meloidogyne hapla]